METNEEIHKRAAELAGLAAPGSADPSSMRIIDDAISACATDVTLCKGEPPWFRTASGCKAQGEKVSESDWLDLASKINPKHKERGAFEYKDNRWRFSSYSTLKGDVFEVRRIPKNRKTAEELGIPKAFIDVVLAGRGLVLVTGPSGSGKTTSFAALFDLLNEKQELKIEMLDDPIENVFENRKCFIKQREYGEHFTDWQEAIEDAMQHDPDVIVVGEMRTKAAMQAAITAAETGHMVFGTLHTRTAAGAVRRLTDALRDQPDVLGQFADCFTAVLAQQLLTADGPMRPGERVTVYELLLRTTAVVNVIREGHPEKLAHELATGGGQGMSLMDDALGELVRTQRLRPATAAREAVKRDDFLRRYAPGLLRAHNA
jgi:twitching motility protein PilT